jgi:hypothetical protein
VVQVMNVFMPVKLTQLKRWRARLDHHNTASSKMGVCIESIAFQCCMV